MFGFFLICGGMANHIIYALVRPLKELFKMQMMQAIRLFVGLSQSLLQCAMRMVNQLRLSMMIHYLEKAFVREGKPLDMTLSTK